MFKKVLGISLAGVLALSSVSALTVFADDSNAVPGGFGKLKEWGVESGTVNPESVYYQTLKFAMPGCWINEKTETNPNGKNSAGIYWWSGYNTPDKIASDGHGWPGYLAPAVKEEGVTNLFASKVPTYGNGEGDSEKGTGNATMIIWDNYIDGGTVGKADPFYNAAAQTADFAAQYYSRNDLKTKTQFEKLFRYIYAKQADDNGLDGADELLKDLDRETFWEDINKLAAVANKKDWNKLSDKDKKIQIEDYIDGCELDFSEFGDYEDNFFNQDLAGTEECEQFPEEDEDPQDCLSFVFDNMVYVVDLDPANMSKSPLSGKLGFSGDVYFYYGNGDYGTWPTQELNAQYGGVKGNFATGAYIDTTMKEIMDKYDELHKDDPTDPADPSTPGGGQGGKVNPANPGSDTEETTGTNIPDPDTDDAQSTKSEATVDNAGNGAIQTGQASVAVIAIVVIIAGVGAVFFAKKRMHG